MTGLPVRLVSLADLPPIEEPEETGTTFEENARLKAHHYSARSGLWTVAEDSGLVIDALHGEPGVKSARFLRPNATYSERFTEIYRRLDARPDAPRTARFVAALSTVENSDVIYETTGIVEGAIADAPWERRVRIRPDFLLPAVWPNPRGSNRSRENRGRTSRDRLPSLCRVDCAPRTTMNGERRTMGCSPFVTQSLAADAQASGSSRAGRVGWSALRLVRKEMHRPAWQVQLVRSEWLAPDRTA